MSVGKGGKLVVSWAHQRTRELGDRLLDDADGFRKRWDECAYAWRRAALAIVDTVLDVPAVCRERLRRVTLRARWASSNALEAVRDLAWVIADGAAWMRLRRGKMVALTGAPLVPALALVIAFSTSAAEPSALGAASALAQGTAQLTVKPVPEGHAPLPHTMVAKPEVAPRPARARVRRSPAVRSATPMSVAPVAVAQRPAPVRAAPRPKVVRPVVAPLRPRHPAAPRAGSAPTGAPARVVPVASVARNEPLPVALPATVQQQPEPSVPAAAPLPSANPPSDEPAVPRATPPAPPVSDDPQHGGGDEKPKKDRGEHHGGGKHDHGKGKHRDDG